MSSYDVVIVKVSNASTHSLMLWICVSALGSMMEVGVRLKGFFNLLRWSHMASKMYWSTEVAQLLGSKKFVSERLAPVKFVCVWVSMWRHMKKVNRWSWVFTVTGDFDILNVTGPAVCNCLTICELECFIILSTACGDESVTRMIVRVNSERLIMPDELWQGMVNVACLKDANQRSGPSQTAERLKSHFWIDVIDLLTKYYVGSLRVWHFLRNMRICRWFFYLDLG
jgi:hypothetical protein